MEWFVARYRQYVLPSSQRSTAAAVQLDYSTTLMRPESPDRDAQLTHLMQCAAVMTWYSSTSEPPQITAASSTTATCHGQRPATASLPCTMYGSTLNKFSPGLPHSTPHHTTPHPTHFTSCFSWHHTESCKSHKVIFLDVCSSNKDSPVSTRSTSRSQTFATAAEPASSAFIIAVYGCYALRLDTPITVDSAHSRPCGPYRPCAISPVVFA